MSETQFNVINKSLTLSVILSGIIVKNQVN